MVGFLTLVVAFILIYAALSYHFEIKWPFNKETLLDGSKKLNVGVSYKKRKE